jgi:ABC-type polysaccharide/polyol phosphate transport system ATPase subunit
MLAEQTTLVERPPAPASPSAPEVAISVRGVGKMYRIYDRPQDRLKQMLLWRLGRNYGREFWALRDVSFEVKKGETVGIIGRNGSGKSTLLQIIAGTLAPSEGEVRVNGRVAALLELGSGFNPEFTGRENVFLNGAILGISREEMEQRFDDIAAFADIGEFIDQPVKLYSSGMYARLAFAIGIHLNPDIFIIDEALSVGDIFFQSRCVRKLDEYRNTGGTVLFVTHDTYAVERICTRSIVLNKGHKIFEGPNADAINTYYKLERGLDAPPPHRVAETPLVQIGTGVVELRRDHVTGDGSLYIEALSILDQFGNPTTTFQVGDWMTVRVLIQARRDLEPFDFGVGIRDRAGVLIGGAHTFYRRAPCGPLRAGQQQVLTAQIRLSIMPGEYLLLVGCARNYNLQQWDDYYTLWDCCAIAVVGQPAFWGQALLDHQIDCGPSQHPPYGA